MISSGKPVNLKIYVSKLQSDPHTTLQTTGELHNKVLTLKSICRIPVTFELLEKNGTKKETNKPQAKALLFVSNSLSFLPASLPQQHRISLQLPFLTTGINFRLFSPTRFLPSYFSSSASRLVLQ
jgi:hypothetical protein